MDVGISEKGYEKDVVVGQVILSPARRSCFPMAGDKIACPTGLRYFLTGDKIACPTVLLDQGQLVSPAAIGFPST